MSADTAGVQPHAVTPEQVRAFLRQHPDFLKKNLDVVTSASAPERALGDGIADFQHFMVKNLQKDSQALKSRYDVLVEYCRDNLSVQTQVHHAVLRLIRTRSLEQLLEVITIDLLNLFDVDIVRMAMESETRMDASYGEQNYSGIVFIDPGLVDAALRPKKNVLLVQDCSATFVPGLEQIFSDCEAMVASCALLRLEVHAVGKQVLLAFGVRHHNRFHTGQGVELLHFLAQIVAYQLDRYLEDIVA